MSLIDEALKRAQAAHGSPGRPGGGDRPWAPAPLPDQGSIRRRQIVRATVLVSIALLAAGGTLFLFRRAPERSLPLPAQEGSASKGSARTGGLPSVASAREGEGRTSATQALSKPTRAPRNHAVTPVANSGSGSSSPAPASAAPPAAASGGPAALVNGKTYVGSAMLPGGGRLALDGIVYSEANATAILNGRIVGAGESVEGFVISRIEENRVELSGNGVTIFIALR